MFVHRSVAPLNPGRNFGAFSSRACCCSTKVPKQRAATGWARFYSPRARSSNGPAKRMASASNYSIHSTSPSGHHGVPTRKPSARSSSHCQQHTLSFGLPARRRANAGWMRWSCHCGARRCCCGRPVAVETMPNWWPHRLSPKPIR